MKYMLIQEEFSLCLCCIYFRSIDIPCAIVKGIYKSSSHIVGEDDVEKLLSTWNAVHVDGSWQLVHPYLICTPLKTTSPPADWKVIESSREEPPSRKATVLNSFFFAPNPSNFVKLCLPDDSHWQLLDEKVSYSRFIKFPFLRPAFYDSGLELKSCDKSVVISEGGMYTIKIQCLRDTLNDLKLMYELASLDKDFQTDTDWGKLVLCGRNEDMWNVQVKFPIDGTFKISLFAMLFDWFFWVGESCVISSLAKDTTAKICVVPVKVFEFSQ